MAHFYLLDELQSTEPGATIELTGPEAKHASTVSRIRVGETILIGNGRGLIATAEVTSSAKEAVVLRVQSLKHVDDPDLRLTLVQALAKTDRDERAIEAATELGVDSIIPWSAQRSISKWEGPKIAKGEARWAAIVREATKQSIRAYVPEIKPLSSTHSVVAQLAGTEILVLDPTGEISLGSLDLPHSDIACVIGPEGGISEAELEQFRAAGARIVSLGTNILRTSTAGPAALAIINAKLGRC